MWKLTVVDCSINATMGGSWFRIVVELAQSLMALHSAPKCKIAANLTLKESRNL
jgi:hypothetical protein